MEPQGDEGEEEQQFPPKRDLSDGVSDTTGVVAREDVLALLNLSAPSTVAGMGKALVAEETDRDEVVPKPPDLRSHSSSWCGIPIEPPTLGAQHSLQPNEFDEEFNLSFPSAQTTSSATSSTNAGNTEDLAMFSTLWSMDHVKNPRKNASSNSNGSRGTFVPAILVALDDNDSYAPDEQLLGRHSNHKVLGQVQVVHVETGPGGTSRITLQGLPSHVVSLGSSVSGCIADSTSALPSGGGHDDTAALWYLSLAD